MPTAGQIFGSPSQKYSGVFDSRATQELLARIQALEESGSIVWTAKTTVAFSTVYTPSTTESVMVVLTTTSAKIFAEGLEIAAVTTPEGVKTIVTFELKPGASWEAVGEKGGLIEVAYGTRA